MRVEVLVVEKNHPVTVAIRGGDLPSVRRMLIDEPRLATALVEDDDGRASRTLLHVATDWPGHYPNGAAVVTALIEAGADVNARFTGPHTETPLHWAASSDDVAVLDVLLDAGADIDAPGAVIGGGTPLDDATAFGQWNAARRLVERGAATTLWHAATLGLSDRLQAYFAGPDQPTQQEINNALWGACHGGRRPAAEFLLGHGAELDWIPPWENLTPLDAALRSEAAARRDTTPHSNAAPRGGTAPRSNAAPQSSTPTHSDVTPQSSTPTHSDVTPQSSTPTHSDVTPHRGRAMSGETAPHGRSDPHSRRATGGDTAPLAKWLRGRGARTAAELAQRAAGRFDDGGGPGAAGGRSARDDADGSQQA